MRRAVAIGAACALAAAVFSSAFGGYRSGQLSLFLVFAALAVSLDFVWGYSGILSLGQLLPFGIAAYTSAKIANAAPSLSVPMLIMSAGVGAGVAAALGVAMLRRRPSAVVVGLLTLVLSLTLEQLAEQWRDVTGGFNGLTGVPRLGDIRRRSSPIPRRMSPSACWPSPRSPWSAPWSRARSARC